MDGAWVDGECWASVPDYGEPALEAFRAATGIQDVPRKAGEPHWYEFLQFNREAFRNYLRHYIAEVKKTNPETCSSAATGRLPTTCPRRSARRWTGSRAISRRRTPSIPPAFPAATWRTRENRGT